MYTSTYIQWMVYVRLNEFRDCVFFSCTVQNVFIKRNEGPPENNSKITKI